MTFLLTGGTKVQGGSLGSLEKAGLLPGPRLRPYNGHGTSILFAQEWFRNSSKDGDDGEDENEDEDDGKYW